jgi:CheY-like chemotaxis protein
MPHRTALVVDPDPNTIDSVRELLPWREVRVESTADPQAAIECLEKGSYCGLILDLGLASGDSLDVLRHMSDRHMDIPIVVVASQFPDSIRELPIAPAIKLVVARPIDPPVLASIILGLCGM